MSRMKTRLSIAAAAVLLTAGLAAAQPESQTTFITFDAPVSLPGVTLAPGTYTFKLLESQTNRHIVQVFDKERSKIFATIIAIAAERPEPADETVITFRESPANAPPAIRFWYYPGNTIGHEFAYPKEQAVMIARASGEPVLSYETEQSELTRVDATGAAAETQAAQPQAQAPVAQQPTEVPETQPSPQPAPADMPAPSPDMQATGTSGRLPQTASNLPLVGLVGLLALGGALLLRAVRAAS